MSTALDRVYALAREARVPLNAAIELTWRCNLRCVHCFQDGLRDQHEELTTVEWKAVLDDLAALGCIRLTITGGEPLMRRDFVELYEYAHAKGFLITLFSNAALIREEHVSIFAKRPPRTMEISLYGTSAEKYEAVARRGSAFAPVLDALRRMSQRKLPVVLKVVSIRPLVDELGHMRRLASEFGFRFRWDSTVTPRLDGNRAPLAYRLLPAEIAALDASDRMRAEALCIGRAPSDGRVLHCSAATTAVSIDPSGHVRGCQVLRNPAFSVRPDGFGQAWSALEEVGSRRSQGLRGTCGVCRESGACSACPGIRQLETGELESPVEHYCRVAEERTFALRSRP